MKIRILTIYMKNFNAKKKKIQNLIIQYSQCVCIVEQ